jgi:WD40 repeat protein
VSLKVSLSSLSLVKQARQEIGWAINDPQWLEIATQILEPKQIQFPPYAYGISYGTWTRFLGGKSINAQAFKAYCQVLRLNWEEIVDRQIEIRSEDRHKDWYDAPDPSWFYGRSDELTTLQEWIVTERCKLIGIIGIGGVGKTLLASKLAELVEEDFNYLIWRSLENAPPPEQLINELIQFLSQQQETELTIPQEIDGKIRCLLKYLANSRCLIILDNWETILASGAEKNAQKVGTYRQEYEGYQLLLQKIATSSYQSCLLLTSREKPHNLAILEGVNLPIRSWQLQGLDLDASQTLLQLKNSLIGSPEQWQTLIECYQGNPLALKIVATTIVDLFENKIELFLKQKAIVFGDIQDLLQQQLSRLSPLENNLMNWLAIIREPVTITELLDHTIDSVSQARVLEALTGLSGRSLVEKVASGFSQQPVVMEYLTNNLIEQIEKEIVHLDFTKSSSNISFLHSYPLLQAQAKDYIKDSQIRLFLEPIAQRLVRQYPNKIQLESHLKQVLAQIRSQFGNSSGYSAGNIINLLHQLKIDLTNYDFSHLTIWQADLQNVPLQQVNLAHSDLSKSVFARYLESIYAVAINSDETLVAVSTADREGTIRLFDWENGQQIKLFLGHANCVAALAFSSIPGKQGFLASGSFDSTIKLWDVASGTCQQTFTEHQHYVITVAFSPDCQLLASGSCDGTVKLWDIASGTCQQTFTGHSNWVSSVAFSPDGQMLASASLDGTVKLWDLASVTCQKTLLGYNKQVWSVAFVPFPSQPHLLASAGEDAIIRIWDTVTENCLQKLAGHFKLIHAIAFINNGQTLVSASEDQTVRLWDWQTERCERVLTGHSNVIWSVAANPESNKIVSGSWDSTVKIWHSQTGKCLKTIPGYSNWIWSIATSSDRSTLISGSQDYQIRIWNLTRNLINGKCRHRVLSGHQGWVLSVVLSPNEQIIASSSEDGTIKIWELATGKCLHTLKGHQGRVWSVAFTPDGQTLISGSSDCTIKLWNLSTYQCYRTLTGHDNAVLTVAVSPIPIPPTPLSKEGIIASGGYDETVKLWDITTGQCLHTMTEATNWVWSVKFSPDGLNLAAAVFDSQILVWDVPTGKLKATFAEDNDSTIAVDFSPDNQIIASGSNQTITFRSLATGEILHKITAHQDLILSVKFTADGKSLASSGTDERIKLWDTTTGECLQELKCDRLYENLNIAQVNGLSPATIKSLLQLGARK